MHLIAGFCIPDDQIGTQSYLCMTNMCKKIQWLKLNKWKNVFSVHILYKISLMVVILTFINFNINPYCFVLLQWCHLNHPMQVFGKDIGARRCKGCTSWTTYCNYGKVILYYHVDNFFHFQKKKKDFTSILWPTNNLLCWVAFHTIIVLLYVFS